MFVFIIWLNGEIPQNYQACIDSIKAIYPQLVIVRDWGDCPYPQVADPRRASEVLRKWILSQHEEALYLDADITLKQKLTFDKTDKPVFGADKKGVDVWLTYHKGQKEFFNPTGKDGVCIVNGRPCTILTPNYYYQISGDEKFIHGRFTGKTLTK